MGITADPFVGRHNELAQLTAALEGVLAGQGRIVMLVGEPGIGKTRLAEEFAQIAKHRGVEVLWGRCREERGAPPFWPWAQAVGSHAESVTAETLRNELGPDAAIVGEVIPAVREKLSDLGPAPALDDPEAARFRLFGSLASMLRRIARSRPTLIVLDDLHWADAGSLRFLEFLAPDVASLSLLVLGTYRDVEVSRHAPLARTLGELVRQRSYSRLVLRGIDVAATTSMIRSAGLTEVSGRFASEIHTQTEGNPLFIRETTRLLASSGTRGRASPGDDPFRGFRLPDGIREAIGRRLDRLSPECNGLLTLAAVVGRRFALSTLVKLSAPSSLVTGDPGLDERAIGLIEEALQARIIEEVPGTADQYQFTHALIGEALASELPTTRRVRLHARIATSLEQTYGDRSGDHAAELARHFSEAETVLGADKVVRYSALAGEQSLASSSYEEAVRHFERALGAHGRHRDELTANLLFGLGRSQSVVLSRHEIQRAIDALRESFALYLELDDKASALRVARFPIPVYHGTRGVTEMLEKALDLAGQKSAATGALAQKCALFASMERGELRTELFERAIALAAEENDPNGELGARTWYATCIAYYRGSDVALRMTEAAEALLPKCADELLRWEALESSSSIRIFFRQDWSGALPFARAALESARKLRGKYQLVFEYANLALIHSMLGNWQDARAYADEGRALDPGDWRVLAAELSMSVALGDRDRTLAALRQPGNNVGWLPPASEIAALGIPPAEMVDCVERYAANNPLLEPLIQDGYMLARAEALVAAGDVAGARKSHSYIGSRILSLPDHSLRRTRRLARVVSAYGDHDTAATLYEETIELCRQTGAIPALGCSLHDYAEMLLTGTGPHGEGQLSRAAALIQEAEPIAAKLGMKPLAERLAALREKLGPEVGGGGGVNPDGLTDREVEVLRLVAQAKSNSEIAAKLVITQNTAAKHVANILGKIGAANRTEAATYALKHHLTDASL